MRKIEQDMLNAVRAMRTWVGGNTQTVMGDHGILSIRLHGHTIAWALKDGSIKVNEAVLAEWPTRTTKSRLRALGVNVYTKGFVTYVEDKPVTI